MTATALPGVCWLEPIVHEDHRGHLFEVWRADVLDAVIGPGVTFVQENQSHSRRNVLRGIHVQLQPPQGKLVRVVAGEILDVAVDLRRRSPTFGQWVGVTLSAGNHRQLWVPPGFGHAFLVLGEQATVLYKMTAVHLQDKQGAVRWDDPQLGIDWPLQGPPVLSAKDAQAPLLGEATLPD